jgi:hypothetical protein
MGCLNLFGVCIFARRSGRLPPRFRPSRSLHADHG